MYVRNKNLPLGTLKDKKTGKDLTGDRHGVFEVDPDFGNWLCGTPGWEPVDGSHLGTVTSRPSGVSEEDHARALIEKEQAAKAALIQAQEEAGAAAAAKAAAEDQTGRDQEAQSLDGTNASAPEEAEVVGPSLEDKTKDELLAVAEEWQAKGYAIDTNNKMTKLEIKTAIHEALYQTPYVAS